MANPNYVTLTVPGSNSMDAYISIPKGGSGSFPAVIVLQEAFGVNSHIRNICDRLASQGYVTIAPELFHRTAEPRLEISYTDFPSVMPHINGLTYEAFAADLKTTFEWTQQQNNIIKNKIGCIGFCLGGRVSMIANIELPLSAAVSYYGGNKQSILDRLKELHAPQLMFWGGLDKHIPHEQVEAVITELKKANKPFINVEISYADHGFNCDEKSSYNPKAAKEAWAMTSAFLENNLK